MAVRFLPPPEDRAAAPAEDRGDLAEVIEFRSRLGARPAEPAHDADPSADASAPQPEQPVPSSASARGGNVIDAVFGAARADRTGSDAQEAQRSREARRDAKAPADSTVWGAQDDDADADSAPARSANDDAVRLLARRARSSGELRAELVVLGHDPNEVEDVIDEFVRSLYLDDLGLARIVTEKLRDSKRASRSQIRQKLRERKFDDEAIETALGELDEDEEFALLRRTALERARRLGGVDRQTAERRLLGFLARRGWSGEPAVRAVRDALDGTGLRSRGPASAGGPRSSGGRGSGVRFE